MQAQQLKRGLLQLFCKTATQKSGFGPKSCAADKQASVFGVFELKNYSVPNIVTINGLNLQTVLFTTLQNQVRNRNPSVRL